MRSNLTALILAIGGSLLLAPLVADGVMTGRWPLIGLALLSAIVISNRESLKVPRPNDGALFLVLGALLLIVGYAFDIDKLTYLAGALFLATSLFHRDRYSIKGTAAITLCLCAMVPLPSGIEAQLSTTLAEAEAALFVAIGQLFGGNFFQVGSQVVFNNQAITINNDCSGTLLLLPALLGAVVVASLSNQSWLRSLLILLVAAPVAIIINIFRLFVLLGVGFYSPEALTEELHDTLGWLAMTTVWIVPIILFSKKETLALALPNFGLAQAISCLLIVGTATAGISAFTETPKNLPNVSALPFYVEGWIGEDEAIPAAEEKLLKADSVVRRRYVSPDGNRALVVTLIFHQDSKTAALHSSAACFKAMGWETTLLGREQLTANSSIEHLMVRDHNRQQAVAELNTELFQDSVTKGVFRLQVVETDTVPLHERQKIATIFMDAALGERKILL